MYLSLKRAVIKTILYADVFDYPLTLPEIWRWLIGLRIKNKELPARNALLCVAGGRIKNIKNIEEKGGYYFLKGRNRIVDLRKNRKKWSEEKLKSVQEITALLKFIPTIKLVGITGALAVENAKEDDDIDLFIVTSAGLLWTTRFLSTLIVEFTGNRRHPQEENVNNKICLNMFVDENNLEIPKREQDLFSAHEVLQMKPIFSRDYTFEKFLMTNQWVKRFLPNAITIKNASKTPRGWQAERSEATTPPMVEELAKRFQLWYMRNRRTKEVIRDGMIRFHPHDAREWVMRKYQKRLRLLATI